MSDFFTASTATPPKRAVRRVTRTDRQSVDSTSSLASTDIQTPDRATFPRFTSAAVEAGPSCFRSARTAGAEAEGDVETVWDDMEAGGLLEVKIGSLLDLTPRMSACYLRPISPSSDLAFEQDYEVQPDDSPLLPPTYISPRQNVAPVPIPHFALPVRAPVHLASTPSGSGKRVRPRNRPSTADTAPIPFGARPHAPPPSAGMSRTSSENLDVRSQGLGIDFGPSTHPARRVESKRCSRSSHDREEILSITDYPYLGRLSFGGSHLSIPSFLSDPATTEHHAYAGKDKGKGKMQEPERDRDQGKGYGREGISRGSHPSLPLTPPSAGLANFNNHFRTPSSSSSFTASSIRTTGSTTSNRSGPPRSIPSRTSSRQQDTRPPPALAFAPPPRSSSLAVIARPTSISQPQQRQANRYSCASVVSVISDHSDIAPPLPASTSNFRLLPPAIPSRSYIPNKARRQAIYLSRTTSHPLEETLATFTESRDLEDSPTGAWSLRPSAPHAPLRRSRSSPCIRSNNCNDDSHDMSLRSKSGLRESQSFLMPKAGIPSHGSMKRFSRRLQKSPPAPPVPPKDRSTQPPSPGSPFKSRASRLGLSDLWGGKLHPQGIMHIASTSRSRAELHSLDSSGSLSTAPSLNLDMGPGLDIDLDLDLTDRPLPCSETFRSVEGPTSTSTSTEARSIRMSNAAALAAARKARIVASGGKGEVYNPYDYAVADILAEVEAEDEEYVLYLADRAEDLVAWKEAQGWDWPEPPYRPIGPLDTVGTVVEIRVDNAESVGRDGTPSKAGMPVRAPRFLTTRPKGLGPEAKRNTRQARRETGTEGKRDSAGSQGATSMKSAGTSSSLAETAILTPESIHPSTANDYIEARLSTASQKHKGEKAPMLFADSIVSSLCPSAAPTIHVDCPTTPTPSTLPLGPEMGIDNDITPKAPSRSDSLRDMAHATADPGSLKLTALNDADTGTTQRYMSIRYGSTSSLPLLSIPDTSASYILNDLSNRHATAASNADPGSVGVATEVGRERQYSVIRAWKNKRKLEKQAAAELKAKARADLSLAAEANFASMPVPMPTPTPALPSSSAAELAAKPTQNAKEKEGARGKEDKAQQGPGKKAGSAGKAAGRMLWTAMSYGSDLRV